VNPDLGMTHRFFAAVSSATPPWGNDSGYHGSMHTISKSTALAVALAFCAHVATAQTQTDAQPDPAPQSIPGIIVHPTPQPRAPLPAGNREDVETCPATDMKKLELVS
jgi:hypothetical protein